MLFMNCLYRKNYTNHNVFERAPKTANSVHKIQLELGDITSYAGYKNGLKNIMFIIMFFFFFCFYLSK